MLYIPIKENLSALSRREKFPPSWLQSCWVEPWFRCFCPPSIWHMKPRLFAMCLGGSAWCHTTKQAKIEELEWFQDIPSWLFMVLASGIEIHLHSHHSHRQALQGTTQSGDHCSTPWWRGRSDAELRRRRSTSWRKSWYRCLHWRLARIPWTNGSSKGVVFFKRKIMNPASQKSHALLAFRRIPS